MTATPVVRPPDPPRIRIRSPADLIAAIPYLLGFHPAQSVVVVAFHDGRLVFTARSDLPSPQTPPAGELAQELITLASRQAATAVALVGYGTDDQVDTLLPRLREAASQRGLALQDVLRVEGGRWWSYICDDPGCCPPEGSPIDLTASEISARCTVEGLTALPDRQELVRAVAPIEGLARAAMTQATDRAEQRLLEWLAGLPEQEWLAAVRAEGATAVETAVQRYGDGGTLSDDELAWLSVLLTSTEVRDLAWRSIVTPQPHLRLWSDAVRRVDPLLAAPVASLLGFAAWREGDGVLARLALERALREDSSYTMASLLLEALEQGLPPSTMDGWGTPAWPELVARDGPPDRPRRPARASRPRRRGRRRR